MRTSRSGTWCAPASATCRVNALCGRSSTSLISTSQPSGFSTRRCARCRLLSNNDGCCVARSEEAKALHIKMGAPVCKIRETIRRHGIQLRSSNYELYANLNRRFNAVIAEHSDTVEIYSIDESFFRLPVRPDGLGNVAAAHQVRDAVMPAVGLPTRVGLGPTRALTVDPGNHVCWLRGSPVPTSAIRAARRCATSAIILAPHGSTGCSRKTSTPPPPPVGSQPSVNVQVD